MSERSLGLEATGEPDVDSVSLRDMIEEVLLLQPDWSSRKTPEMDRRGQLVRNGIPDWLRRHLLDLQDRATWPEEDLSFEGRDGTGLKTEIPWVRLYSKAKSVSATNGWYIVFLFSAIGDRCYLSLCHGATRWDGGEFKPRPEEEMAALMAWGRSKLGAELNLPRLTSGIALDARRSELGHSYEIGTLGAFEYDLDRVPDDDQLLEDLRALLGPLSLLYAAESVDPNVPGAPPPEVVLAASELEESIGKPPRQGRAQGFRLTKSQQRAVECRAVEVATAYLKGRRWMVKYVGDKESYDLDCRNDGVRLFVEVKGTMSTGETVVLTRNEVELHRREYPHNALIVVHGIQLDRITEPPAASGGTVDMISPWEVDAGRLEPLAYTYRRALDTPAQATWQLADTASDQEREEWGEVGYGITW